MVAEPFLTLSGIAQNSLDVGGLQIRENGEDGGLAHAVGEILEHIGNRDTGSGQARFAATHAWRAGDQRGSGGGDAMGATNLLIAMAPFWCSWTVWAPITAHHHPSSNRSASRAACSISRAVSAPGR
jgi:hypothetical protein